MGQELIDCGTILPGVLIPGLGVSPPDGLGLRRHVQRELLDQFLELHHQIPFLMFSMASNPNSRWASYDCVLNHFRTVKGEPVISRRTDE